MAVFHTVTFAAFFLENDHFVTFYEGNSYLAYYFCTFNGRRTDLNVTVGISEEHAVKFHFVALFYVFAEVVNIQELVFFSFELLSLNFYNYKHFNLLFYKLLRRVERPFCGTRLPDNPVRKNLSTQRYNLISSQPNFLHHKSQKNNCKIPEKRSPPPTSAPDLLLKKNKKPQRNRKNSCEIQNFSLNLHRKRPDGGIGRRAGLKHQWGNPSRFEPGSGYRKEDSHHESPLFYFYRPGRKWPPNSSGTMLHPVGTSAGCLS